MRRPDEHFQAIQTMLTAGHRCVHLERHSLLLIGGVGGFLSVATQWIITDTRFPEVTQRGVALLLWLAFWLGGLSLLDYWLTRRARQKRAETLPFAQAQITRAWWMLLSVGCLGSFAMHFYGGGAMIYALWIVLLGLGIYFFGLFSQPLIEWIGLSTILLGVASLAAGLPFGSTRWLAASAFAIGLPLAGWLNAHVDGVSTMRRLLALAIWLVVVTLPPLFISCSAHTPTPAVAPILSGSAVSLGEQVLRLEAGARVPLRVDMDSPLLNVASSAELSMILAVPVEVALQDGKPDGRYRLDNGQWHTIQDGILQLRIDRLTPQLENNQPVVRAHANFNSAEFIGGSR